MSLDKRDGGIAKGFPAAGRRVQRRRSKHGRIALCLSTHTTSKRREARGSSRRPGPGQVVAHIGGGISYWQTCDFTKRSDNRIQRERLISSNDRAGAAHFRLRRDSNDGGRDIVPRDRR